MTREAKIGMLTGLGVIVLIGVLLSEYLGDTRGMAPAASAGASSSANATGRMAELPIGSNYRQQVMEPIGVPGMVRADAPMSGLGGGEAAMPLVMSNNATPPAAYAADNNLTRMDASPGGPVVGQPVAAVAVGPAPMDPGMMTGPAGAPPTISVAEAARPVVPVMVASTNTGNSLTPTTAMQTAMAKDAAAKPAVPGVTYSIVAGDNLAKIAKKFYGTSKESDVKRIVAANPAVLKDANSPLIVGKKLTIPNVPAPVTAKSPTTPGAPERVTGAREADPARLAKILARTTEPVMIYLPGSQQSKADTGSMPTMQIKADAPKSASKATTAKEQPKKEAPKIYSVQNGDTLEKIAKKMAPSNASAYVAKLKSLNAVKDPTDLQVGQKLKLPV